MSQQAPLIARELKLSAHLPEEMRRRLAGRPVSFALPRAVRMRLRRPEKISVSGCAAKYRRVTGVDVRPGPWRNELVPHTVFAMDLYQQPWLEELWLCWPERSAKTNVMLNCLVWAAKCDPGNVFWLEPTEPDAGKNLKTKIIPMFRESPGLKKYLSRKADDTGKGMITFAHGMYLFPASANSAGSMANFYAKHAFCNEADKYPPMVGTETDPIKLIRKRGRDGGGSKRLFGSTPAGRFIYKGTMACRQVWQYKNRCPHCDQLVLMDDEHLDIPEGASADEVENGDVEVGYVCNACAAVWTEYERERSYLTGKWECVKGADDPRPKSVGLHASALPFPMIPLSEYCGKYLRSKTGEESDRIDYAHGYQVKDYQKEQAAQISEAHVLKFRSELPRNLVPPDTVRLALIVDPQQSAFNYQVWALGYAPRVTLHMVRHGILDSFEDLDGLISGEVEEDKFRDHEGREFRISCGLIDSGGTRRNGQKHSRTYEVYEWCSRNRLMTCLKGVFGRNGEMLSYKIVSTYPGTNKPIPGGLKRVNVRVDIFKDNLESRLGKEPDDPGALSFHGGIDEAFARHFTGETKDDDGNWQHTKKSQRIDYMDCTNYALVLREMLKLRIPRKPAADPEPPSPPQPSFVSTGGGGFVGGWR